MIESIGLTTREPVGSTLPMLLSMITSVELLTDHFSTYCEKRRNHFRAHLQRLLADFETQARSKEEAATAAENFIQQMNEALGNLGLPLANATASMK